MSVFLGASCAGQPSYLWFPDAHQDATIAKTICGACPCADACLDTALENNELTGVWGGIWFDEERRKVKNLKHQARRHRVAV